MTPQGEAKLRIPLMERYLISKRERGRKQRLYNPEEIEKERQHIRGNMRETRFNECEDLETSDTEGKTQHHLKRVRE